MKKLLSIIVLVIVIWIAHGALQKRALRPLDPDSTERITVTIPEGSSLKTIAQILEDDGVIRSAGAFRSLVKREDMSDSLQAGTFVLRASMDSAQVMRSLTTTGGEQLSVTIPEGFTIKDIDELLTAKGLINSGDILDCARTCSFVDISFLPKRNDLASRGGNIEGYVFPDTYFVSTADFTAEDFLIRMLRTFESKIMTPHKADIAASGKSLHELVTMASLIEEETRNAAERPIVSGILWKRLREGMRLDVDAAVRYFLDKPSAAITKSDLERESPYNLRSVRGLPPGPIANPSLDSFEAALRPEQTEYYYYLHGNDGRIRYARTNDEHNQNRARYLQ